MMVDVVRAIFVLLVLVRVATRACLSTAPFAISGWANAEVSTLYKEPFKEPTWEVGLALGGQALMDYRGSKEHHISAYPIPFFIYRGDFFKADRDGVRAQFIESKHIELDLSAEAALNGGSKNNRLREDMPELESAFELGPSLNINITGEDFSSGWALRLPLRAAFTVGGTGVHYRGLTFNPRFTWTAPDVFDGWKYKANLGVLFSSRRYHDYYYSVDEQYVLAERPHYEAEGGFSGYYFKTSLSRRDKNFLYGLSLRYDMLEGTVFEDSPLVETNDYFAVSFMLAWVGWQSVN